MLAKESEKKHKRIMDLKAKFKAMSSCSSSKDLTAASISDKSDTTVAQLKQKIEALEKYKAKKKKLLDKEVANLNAQLGEAEKLINEKNREVRTTMEKISMLKSSIMKKTKDDYNKSVELSPIQSPEES